MKPIVEMKDGNSCKVRVLTALVALILCGIYFYYEQPRFLTLEEGRDEDNKKEQIIALQYELNYLNSLFDCKETDICIPVKNQCGQVTSVVKNRVSEFMKVEKTPHLCSDEPKGEIEDFEAMCISKKCQVKKKVRL